MAGIHQLRPYQRDIARAIYDSVAHARGLTFTVEMSRQSGKNELSALVEASLLTQLADDDAHLVKAAPTFTPQAQISLTRLVDTLRAGHVPHTTEQGHIVRVGNARAHFLSAEPTANIVGKTATHLLEVDEAQDVSPDKYDKDLRPMAAANNATTVLYGTPWLETDLLHRERQAALAAQRRDGVRRAFVVQWTTPAALLPAYASYVAAERARLGESHPLFLSQYELQPLPGGGRLFGPDQLAQLQGEHARRTTRPASVAVAAGLDLAGASDRPGVHDLTVLTLAAVLPPPPFSPTTDPHLHVLHHIAWQNVPHETLVPTVIDLIVNVWKPDALAVDATGLGETTAALLQRAARSTTTIPVKFSQQSKSVLGYALQAAVTTGRVKQYLPDHSPQSAAFWEQARLCRVDYRPNQLMNFYVDPADGHDDYVSSLALTLHAAQFATPRVARGTTRAPT
jgi:hypothetical protein